MLKFFAKSIFSFLIVMLLSVISIGCSSRHLEQNPVERYYEESAPAYSLEQSEKNATEQGKFSSASLLLSVTPLQVSRPISLAVGEREHYAYVLSHPEDSK